MNPAAQLHLQLCIVAVIRSLEEVARKNETLPDDRVQPTPHTLRGMAKSVRENAEAHFATCERMREYAKACEFAADELEQSN